MKDVNFKYPLCDSVISIQQYSGHKKYHELKKFIFDIKNKV